MSRSLLSLPVELCAVIAEQCVQRLESNDEILLDSALGDDLTAVSRLSRTCKILRESSAPALFRRVVLDNSGLGLSSFLSALAPWEAAQKASRHVQHLSLPTPTWTSRGVQARDALYKELQTLPSDERTANAIAKVVSGEIDFDALPFVALKSLVNLKSLAVSPAVFASARRLPPDDRYLEASLTRLRFIHAAKEYAAGYQIDLPKAFRVVPVVLKSLDIHLSSPPSNVLVGKRWSSDGWQLIFQSLQRLMLDLSYYDEFLVDVSTILASTPRLTHLRLRASEKLSIKEALQAMSSRAAQLECLEISTGFVTDVISRANLPFLPLDQFEKLTTLSIPMMGVPSHQFPSRPWPPLLENLTLAWDELPHDYFVRMIAHSLRCGQFPPSLVSITLLWDIEMTLSRGLIESAAEFQDVFLLLYALRSLEEACKFTGTALLHHSGRYPNERPHRLGTLRMIAEEQIQSYVESGVMTDAFFILNGDWDIVEQKMSFFEMYGDFPGRQFID